MSGLATFRPLSRQVLQYREEGVLSLTSGTSHSAFRTLFYLNQDDHILVCFRPSSRPKDLLHRLAVGRAEVPWPQNVDDTHICGADSYHGRYGFETPVRITIAITVRGPRKNALINTLLLKSAPTSKLPTAR